MRYCSCSLRLIMIRKIISGTTRSTLDRLTVRRTTTVHKRLFCKRIDLGDFLTDDHWLDTPSSRCGRIRLPMNCTCRLIITSAI
jgi:hypothetical protein